MRRPGVGYQIKFVVHCMLPKRSATLSINTFVYSAPNRLVSHRDQQSNGHQVVQKLNANCNLHISRNIIHTGDFHKNWVTIHSWIWQYIVGTTNNLEQQYPQNYIYLWCVLLWLSCALWWKEMCTNYTHIRQEQKTWKCRVLENGIYLGKVSPTVKEILVIL
jgi:hypothetical protein